MQRLPQRAGGMQYTTSSVYILSLCSTDLSVHIHMCVHILNTMYWVGVCVLRVMDVYLSGIFLCV